MEEMAAFVNRALENPNNWMVHSTALLLRSRLEKEKFRTAGAECRTHYLATEWDLSLLRLCVCCVVSAHISLILRPLRPRCASAAATRRAVERHRCPRRPARTDTCQLRHSLQWLLWLCAHTDHQLPFIFALGFPARWELKRELGEGFIDLGAAASALSIFEALQLWDEIIRCYQVPPANLCTSGL